MKITQILAALALLSTTAAQAATFVANASDTGLTASTGSSPVASGTVRFGIFSTGFDFASNNNFAALDANFVEVASFSGAISDSGFDGFFNYSTTYSESGTFESTTPYDLSPGIVSNVGGDIAGEKIYMWVLNNTTAGNATEHAIFSSNATWTDANVFPVNNSAMSIDAGTPGLTAHIGSLGAGPDIGGGNPSHRLAAIGAVPEPSRAMLGFIGLALVLFRRRRA